MDAIRLLDLGLVPPIRSQTIYHAVAYALDENSPDTIILVAPTDPYVCIGFHQELEKEVDVEYCRAHGLPMVRREVGGGAVYLDRNQVFAQWIFHRDALPDDVGERFALYVKPLVETYQALGIPANYRPINDVHVQGKKIGGTGAAQMGLAQVVVGSLMFDFNFNLMSRVLKVSSEKMRDKIYQSLNEYMTTMTRQLGHTPDRDAVAKIYLEQVQAALGRRSVRGEPAPAELALLHELDRQFVTDEWLSQKGGLRQAGIKIHQDVRVAEANFEDAGRAGPCDGAPPCRACGRCDAFGGFYHAPPVRPGGARARTTRHGARTGGVRERIGQVYRALDVQSPGVSVDDLTNAVMLLK